MRKQKSHISTCSNFQQQKSTYRIECTFYLSSGFKLKNAPKKYLQNGIDQIFEHFFRDTLQQKQSLVKFSQISSSIALGLINSCIGIFCIYFSSIIITIWRKLSRQFVNPILYLHSVFVSLCVVQSVSNLTLYDFPSVSYIFRPSVRLSVTKTSSSLSAISPSMIFRLSVRLSVTKISRND